MVAPMTATTPRALAMMQLLGSKMTRGNIALTRDEYEALRRLYGFKQEKPNKKPAPPVAPDRSNFKSEWDYTRAVADHEQALKTHERWEDPVRLMQAGADRNMARHAEADGLRLLAWIARYVPAGGDPLKVLVQLAADGGWDVDPEDTAWADDDWDDDRADVVEMED